MQRVENAYSRVPNGDFSHGVAHWGGRLALNITTPVVVPGVPYYALVAASEFWVDIPYRDLMTYPAVVDFPSVAVYPYNIGEFYLFAREKFVGEQQHPFQINVFEGGLWHWGTAIPRGEALYVDDTLLGIYSGEFRVIRAWDGDNAVVSSSEAYPVIMSEEDTDAFYSKSVGAVPVFTIRTGVDVRLAPRPGGAAIGVQLGDYFVCAAPRMSGRITKIALDGLSFQVSVQAPHILPASTGGVFLALSHKWAIMPVVTGVMRRNLPVCLYDLTLAYTMLNGSLLSPNDVWLELYDETGNLVESKRPAPIGTGGARYLSRAIPNSTYARCVQRFIFEREEPHYGTYRIKFGNTMTGMTQVGDVVLLKGDYTASLPLPGGQTFDYVERQLGDDSEIIPRGTVVAYVGGSVCPAGYTRVEGLGSAGANLEGFPNLYSTLGAFSLLHVSNFGLHRRDGDAEPRSYFAFTATPARTDIHAGYTLEFRFSTHSVFAIISSAGLLKSADPYGETPEVYEIELVGDHDAVIRQAAASTGLLVIWRGGVVSAVQNAPELSAGFESAGGFSLAGPPHGHGIGLSEDIKYAEDVGVPFRDRHDGDETLAIFFHRYYKHTHFRMCTASSIPKVRPVLLCQKI
jgi:hypothetical protein